MKRLLGAVLLLAACGPVGTAADVVADCHNICERYRSCYSADYNIDACDSRCRESAAISSNFRSRVDDCDACLDPQACATTAFACGTRCAGIVP